MNGFSGLYPFPEPELYSTLACTILFDTWHCSNIKSIVLRSIRIHFYNIVSLLHGTIQSSIPIQVRSCQNALFNNKMGMCESWTYRHSPHETQRSMQRLLKDCVQSVEEDEFYEEMKDTLLQHSQFTTWYCLFILTGQQSSSPYYIILILHKRTTHVTYPAFLSCSWSTRSIIASVLCLSWPFVWQSS